MSYRKSLMCEEVERIFHTFDRNLLQVPTRVTFARLPLLTPYRTLETDALTGVETSMFGTVMSKVYREAAQYYGQLSLHSR